MNAGTHSGRSDGGSLRGSSRAQLADTAATVTMWAIGGLVLLILGLIIVHFAIASLDVMSIGFLTGDTSESAVGGVFPIIWNSVYLLLFSLLLSLGILAGIYMSEYAARNRLTETIRFAEEAISSVPSIVVGMFGLILFVDTVHLPFCMLAGVLALTIFNLPLMTRLAEQALQAVPQSERQASLALGATKWQTIRHVVVPLGIPGLITGVILTAGRVFGEAAVLLFTAGQSVSTNLDFTNFNITDAASPYSPFRQGASLAVYVWDLNSNSINPYAHQIANGVAMVLIAIVLIFNLGARGLGRVLTRKLTAA